MKTGLEHFFLPASGGRCGRRLCLHHTPADGVVRAAVLYTHPFAEEMNKSRRMAALASRALAASGCAVMQMDLLGCGDSSGDFGDATWHDWLGDVEQAAAWLLAQHHAPLWMWGLRAGCLLNAEVAARLDQPLRHLFWQPPASGKTLLQQFLRLKLAASLTEGQGQRGEDPRQQLAKGQSTEVAGYALQPALALGLERSQLLPQANVAHSVWLETSTREDGSLLPATQVAAARWREAGFAVQTQVVHGPAFWQTQEIEDAPALVAATVQALRSQPAQGTQAVAA